MGPERWRRVENIFHAATDRSSADRAAFLDSACGDDPGLRDEVEQLIRSFEDSGDFIEKPILVDRVAAAAKSNLSTQQIIGRRIGAYEVLSLIGTGGMGEVYLARDLRLGRRIALKLLPAEFTRQPGTIHRFEREARAASALNHPNIITIYDTGLDHDAHFIATEYIEGRTLRELISSGARTLPEILEIGVQIAGALSAAHAAGIVHRDIKPENVMLRSDGLVKLLDFGLAKPIQSETTTGGLGGFSSIGVLSDPKILMGTIAYLSPEQARGEKVDHRTDLFSLGVVLYEMTTGVRPFAGGSAGQSLDLLLTDQAIDLDNAGVPPALRPILGRSLEKDRQARYQSAEDIRLDLKRLLEENAEQEKKGAGRLKALLAIGSIFLLGGIVALVLLNLRESRTAAFQVGPVKRITEKPGWEVFPSLSPDGQEVVYSSRAAGSWDIYLQKIGDSEAINLTPGGRHVDLAPAFSPDGKQIAFHSSREGGDGVFLMDRDGRNLRKVAPEGHNPAWSPDGRELAIAEERFFDFEGRTFGRSRLHVMNLQTGARRLVSAGDALQPNWSPNGKWIAYWGVHHGQGDLWVVQAAGRADHAPPAPIRVTDDKGVDWNPVWSHDGSQLYFLSNRGGSMNLWRIPIDDRSGGPAGAPEPATLPSVHMQHLSLSADGRSLVYGELRRGDSLWRTAFDPVNVAVVNEPVQLSSEAKRYSCPQPSPDENSLVYVTTGEGQGDLYLLDRNNAQAWQLTHDVSQKRGPRWSPDGGRIVFSSDRSGKNEIWSIQKDGGALEQLTHDADDEAISPVWSPDGFHLAFQMRGHVRGSSAFLLDLKRPAAERTPQPLPGEPLPDFYPSSWSPDGKLLAGWQFLPDKARGGIVIYSFADQRYERLTDFGWNPIWLNDSRRILFVELGKMFVLDVVTRQRREIFSLDRGEFRGHSVSADNRRIYYSQFLNDSDLYRVPIN
jgi:Tol biopolymer transport system component/predicted Ser/Thr protein kinase